MISVGVKLKIKVTYKGTKSNYFCCFDDTTEALNFIEEFKYCIEYISTQRTGKDEIPNDNNLLVFTFKDLEGLRKIEEFLVVKK